MDLRIQFVVLLEVTLFLTNAFGHGDHGDAEALYEWSTIDYDWQTKTQKEEAIGKQKFVPLKNAINGIRLYKDRIFVTVPRFTPGVPSSLNTVVNASPQKPFLSSTAVLKPFPSWEMQAEGNCTAFQLVQNIEIDPRVGIMYVIDTGGPAANHCPAKLIIYDVNVDREIHRHIFPETVVPPGANYLNDLVMDYVAGIVRYLYITNTAAPSLLVYDIKEDNSYVFTHPSMEPEEGLSKIQISDNTIRVRNGINGIAISADFKYVYYSPIAGVSLYQIPTSTLRNSSANFSETVRKVGTKPAQGDGMIMSNENSLYFSVLSQNAVVMWEIQKDIKKYGSEGEVHMDTLTYEAKDPRMQWIDSLALDSFGYLWFTTSRLQLFFGGKLRNDTTNFIIWRAFVHEPCYAHFEKHHRFHDSTKPDNSAQKGSFDILLLTCALLVHLWVKPS